MRSSFWGIYRKELLMKYFIWFTFFCTLFTSCQSDSPSQVAKDFTKSLITADFTNAKKHLARNSLQAVDQAERDYHKSPHPDEKKILDIRTSWAILDQQEKKIDDSTTVIDFTYAVPASLNKSQKVRNVLVMRREEGKWKVDFPETFHYLMGDSLVLPKISVDPGLK